MNEIFSTLFLISGLAAVFVGTTGIFGYSFTRIVTRQQAIYILFAGFFSLIIAGRFNVQNIEQVANQQNPSSPIVVQSSTTSTTFQNNQQNNQTSTGLADVSISLDQLNQLIINDDFSSVPPYDRGVYFGSWIDEDGDCQDTRAEVLIIESLTTIFFRDSSDCTVDSGEWYDPYTDTIYYQASDLDVDHFVPLFEAFMSGGYLWPDHKRKQFANDLLSSEDHLIAVEKGENRSKGKKPPHEWMPPNTNYHCEYLANWINIKYLWELTITSQEHKFLQNELQNC